MNIGFDTIASATVICYDRVPVLVTDPWVTGGAFFGSWTLTHEVPEEQMTAIRDSAFVWFSHGHPDHLNADCLPLFRDKKILLPDHVGKRINAELVEEGYDVRVLKDRVWYSLSDNIRVLCIADYNQDAVLLIDINGRLLVNVNDASDHGWGRFVKRIIKEFPISFLLALECYEDIDMFNLYDDVGNAIRPLETRKNPLGRRAELRRQSFGAKYFVPFSSMHCYQREDSVWANRYGAPLSDYRVGPPNIEDTVLPAFLRYDCVTDKFEEIGPAECEPKIVPASEFGDDWSEALSRDEAAEVTRYFRSIDHLSTFLDFVCVRVGGKDHIVELAGKKFNRGLTFEVPRNSLMIAVRYQVFDDLLIGNFMKTTFHGDWAKPCLYPDFSPYVAKYADNGGARTRAELDEYFAEYRRRAAMDHFQFELLNFLHQNLELRAIDAFRSFVGIDSRPYQITKKMYRSVRRPVTL